LVCRSSCSRSCRAGFATGTAGRRDEAKLVELLDASRVRVLYADEPTTHHYAALFSRLRKQGTPTPTNDLWIAALVPQHALVLFTRDEHSSKLPQIARL
jgi:tRNA(fMet)-specific endonuclease VapC